jgi:hypothetical protein
MMRCVVRKDLADRREELPALMNGWPEAGAQKRLEWIDKGVLLYHHKFRCADLEEETDQGFNMVVWDSEMGFCDLAMSIDWDFIPVHAWDKEDK